MGIGLLIAVLGVGSTLASTITINGGTNTEFGQGVQRTVYCGGNKQISVAPISSYINKIETHTPVVEDSQSHNDVVETSTPGTFYLSGIRVSDIPEECSGVDFVLSIYPSDGNSVVNISSAEGRNLTTPTVFWERKSDGDWGELSARRDQWEDPNPMANLQVGVDGSFTVNFLPQYANMNINDVGRILIETQNDSIDQGFRSLSLTPVHGTRIRS
jgi:hypothetical protein